MKRWQHSEYCPMDKNQMRESNQTQEWGLDYNAPQNYFYALKSRGDQEHFPDVIHSMLQVFSIDVYALLDLGSTLSFVTSFFLWSFMWSPM